MSEAAFRTKLISLLKPHGHVQRIETTTGNGVPDLNFCSPSTGEVWIELKAWGKQPTPLQRAWSRRRCDSGGVVIWAQGGNRIIWRAWSPAEQAAYFALTDGGVSYFIEWLTELRKQVSSSQNA